MAEYSFTALQTVGANDNVQFSNGSRCCKKGYIQHRDDSGIFFVKGSNNGCRAAYAATFTGNIAISAGETVAPISIALTLNGEALGNATAIVTPTVVEAFTNVSITTFVEIPCGCCATVSVKNVSEDTDIDVQNANIIFERIA